MKNNKYIIRFQENVKVNEAFYSFYEWLKDRLLKRKIEGDFSKLLALVDPKSTSEGKILTGLSKLLLSDTARDRLTDLESCLGDTYLLELPESVTAKDVEDLEKKFDFVNYITEDAIVKFIPPRIDLRSRTDKHPFDIINFNPETMNLNGEEEEVVVAVIDSGINYDHPYLKESLWEYPGKEGCYGINFTVEEGDGRYNVLDHFNHGSYVSGIIVADHPDNIVTGMAKRVKILSIKVTPRNSDAHISDICNALATAYVFGANIINNSYDINIRRDESKKDLNDLLYCLERNKCISVFAAGDKEKNVEEIYPQNQNNVITVGSVNDKKERSYRSPWGDKVTVWAPGESIRSTAGAGYIDLFGRSSGTSIAAPFVTATIALIKQKKPNLNVYEIKEILRVGEEIHLDSEHQGYILDVTKSLDSI